MHIFIQYIKKNGKKMMIKIIQIQLKRKINILQVEQVVQSTVV